MIYHIMPDHVEASMPLIFQKFCKILKPNATDKEKKLALYLSWIYQMFSSYYQLQDDYMDSSNNRWGNTTWSKLHNHSKKVILPDISAMRSLCFFTLQKKFSHLPSIYIQVLHLFHHCDDMMSKGILLEKYLLVQNHKDGKVSLKSFNMDTYQLYSGLQFSIFTYLPLALSMTICGYQIDENQELYQKVENICDKFAVWMRVNDDYYEIFTPLSKIDEEATDLDIREGEFTWLFLMAKESCKSDEKIKYLLDNYGKDNDESVKNIRKLLENIEVHDLFKSYRDQTYDNILKHIDSCLKENVEIQELLKWYFDRCLKHHSE